MKTQTLNQNQAPAQMKHGSAVHLLNPDSFVKLVRSAHDQRGICGTGRLVQLLEERAKTHPIGHRIR
jgi:hypothetical protein